jgi:hypothetical protein
MRITNWQRVQKLLAGAATALTLSLAVTLRVERSCSATSAPAPAAPAVVYPYSEVFTAGNAGWREGQQLPWGWEKHSTIPYRHNQMPRAMIAETPLAF